MIAQIDGLPENVNSDNHHDQTRPAKKPGDECSQSQKVDQCDWNRIGPTDLTTDDGVRKGKMRSFNRGNK